MTEHEASTLSLGLTRKFVMSVLRDYMRPYLTSWVNSETARLSDDGAIHITRPGRVGSITISVGFNPGRLP